MAVNAAPSGEAPAGRLAGNPDQPLIGGLVSSRLDSTVVDRQSGSALSANAVDAAAMLVGAVKRYGSGESAVADHVVFVVDGRVHDVMDRPTADSVPDVVKGLGR